MSSLNSLMADNRLLTLGAAIAAFLVFAVLILLLVRLVFGNRLRMSGGRGRQQRLGVVDAYDMDRQRQLVLVRRDNTEHLIMIGGPNDLLIESAILRVEPRDARERLAVTARETAPSETPRIPVPDTWSAPPAPAEPDLAPAVPLPPMAVPTAPPPPAMPASPPVESPRPVDLSEPINEQPLPMTPQPASRPRDFIARMRGRGTPPPAVVAPPPEAPAVAALTPSVPEPEPVSAPTSEPITPSAPPLADADFFETEIAKALAPSMRGRSPVAPPDALAPPLATAAEPDVSEAPIAAQTRVGPAPLPPRTPFRPFPPRRETPPLGGTPAEGSENLVRRPLPPRPPPPPFFSRMNQRPKDRVEPSVADASVAPIGQPELAQVPVHEHVQPPPAEEAPSAREPAVAPSLAPEPATEAKVESEAVDPFEEEMARLLGRTPGKEG